MVFKICVNLGTLNQFDYETQLRASKQEWQTTMNG
jgi:hypothetical protein